MEVLSSSSIATYIIPQLSVGSRGKTDEVPIEGIVRAMLYRLKTGCQWRFLPHKRVVDMQCKQKAIVGFSAGYRSCAALCWRNEFVVHGDSFMGIIAKIVDCKAESLL